jgi:hypothetical protein
MKITKTYLKEQVLMLLEREEEETSVYYVVGVPNGNFNPEVQDEYKKLTYRSKDLHDQIEREYKILKTVMQELNIPESREGIDPTTMRRYMFVRGYNKKDEAKIARIIRERYFNDRNIKFIKLEWETAAMKEARETLQLYGAETEHEYIHRPGHSSHGMPRAGGTLLGQYATFVKGLPKKPEGMKEMKITKGYLKQVIKEEINKLTEQDPQIPHRVNVTSGAHHKPNEVIFIGNSGDQYYFKRPATKGFGRNKTTIPGQVEVIRVLSTEDGKNSSEAHKITIFPDTLSNEELFKKTMEYVSPKTSTSSPQAGYLSPKGQGVKRDALSGHSSLWKGY